jgi:hypothetical protein
MKDHNFKTICENKSEWALCASGMSFLESARLRWTGSQRKDQRTHEYIPILPRLPRTLKRRDGKYAATDAQVVVQKTMA